MSFNKVENVLILERDVKLSEQSKGKPFRTSDGKAEKQGPCTLTLLTAKERRATDSIESTARPVREPQVIALLGQL